MIMTYNDALNRIIADGVSACKESYAKDEQKRTGAVAGFEECRDKTPAQLAVALVSANEEMERAFREQAPNYWYWRCRQAEIEWVVNVMSCILQAQGLAPIGMMTARGLMKAAEIIGVRAAS